MILRVVPGFADIRADSPFVVATFQIGLGAGNLLSYPHADVRFNWSDFWSACGVQITEQIHLSALPLSR
jgi:hypothetical protein